MFKNFGRARKEDVREEPVKGEEKDSFFLSFFIFKNLDHVLIKEKAPGRKE